MLLQCIIDEIITIDIQCNTLEESPADLDISSTTTEDFLQLTKSHQSTQILQQADEGIILHVTDSDLELFPYDTDTKKIEYKDNCIKMKTVTLNKNWIVKGSIGSQVLRGIIEQNSNIDWITFFQHIRQDELNSEDMSYSLEGLY